VNSTIERVERAFPHALAGSLCVGLAAANAVRTSSSLVAALAGVVALAAAAAEPRRRGLLLALALGLAGSWWASVRLDALDRSALVSEVGRAAPARVVVTGPARRGTFALRVPAEARRFGRLQVREAVLLELPLARSPPQGAIVDLVAKVTLPRTDDEFDERAWLKRRGAHVVLSAERWRIVGRRGGLLGAGDRLRERLAETITPGVGGERHAIVAGIVLGEDEGLPADLRDAFRASGLYHLLAVSGQNVAFLAGCVLVLGWLAGLSRLLAELVVLGTICAYVLAVGWQPSVVRAAVAGALASLAWVAARPRDRWYFLLLGAAVLLAWNPYNLLEPGFQLSFAAVAAIFVLVPRVSRTLEGYPVPGALAGTVAVSAACGLVTAPIAWLHFGAVPLYTVLSNALAAPVVGPLLGLGLAAAALHPMLPNAAALVAWANGWLAAYLAACARLVAALPHAQLTSATAVAALAGVIVLAWLGTRATPTVRTRGAVMLAAALALIAAWRLIPGPTLPPPRGLRLTFLDVGQGDAALLQVGGGAVLVDQGPPEARVAEQIRSLGVRRLALLVLTHPQRDHVGGAADVLERLQVDAVLDPRIDAPSTDEAAAMTAARKRDVRVIAARAGQTYRLGSLRLRVLWPEAPGTHPADPNDEAIVLLASYGGIDALLTADAEGDVTTRIGVPPAEILKVAHHGSADELLPDLLRRVRPRVAVISVGDANEYGHPTRSTLGALAAAPGLRVYRTDRDGRVTIETDGRRLEVYDEG
jgi:competence protein ComEC